MLPALMLFPCSRCRCRPKSCKASGPSFLCRWTSSGVLHAPLPPGSALLAEHGPATAASSCTPATGGCTSSGRRTCCRRPRTSWAARCRARTAPTTRGTAAASRSGRLMKVQELWPQKMERTAGRFLFQSKLWRHTSLLRLGSVDSGIMMTTLHS
ncbi:unnamed protein product [Heterosigma akashiwo]